MEKEMNLVTGGVFKMRPSRILVENRNRAPELFYDKNREPIIIKPGEKTFIEIMSSSSINPLHLSPELENARLGLNTLESERENFCVLLDASLVRKIGDLVILSLFPKALKNCYGSRIKISFAVPWSYGKVFWGLEDYIDEIIEVDSPKEIENFKADLFINLNNIELKWKEKEIERKDPNFYKNRTALLLASLGMVLIDKKPLFSLRKEELEFGLSEIKNLQRPVVAVQTKSSCKSKDYPHVEKLISLLIENGFSVIRLDEPGNGGFKYSVRQAAGVMAVSDYVVVLDSGFLHISGALNKRGVAIFGSCDGRIVCEDYEKFIVVQGKCNKPSCWWVLPCLEGSSYQDKKDVGIPYCLESIEPKRVLQALKEQEKAKKVFACMLTWDNLGWTQKAISSIRSFHDVRLFVVDNESKDGTLEWLSKNNIPFFSKRSSVAEAQNIGIKEFLKSDCDYFLLLNNDIVLHKETINSLVRCCEENPDFWGISAVETRGVAPWDIDDAKPESDYKEIISDIPPSAYSCTIFPRACIEKVGLFDENFSPRYIEDNDYTLRIRMTGKKFVRYHKAIFYHILGGVVKTKLEEKNRFNDYWNKNINYYISKWGLHPHEPQDLKKVKPDIPDSIRFSGTFRNKIISENPQRVYVRRKMGGAGDHIFLSVVAEAIKSIDKNVKVIYCVPKEFFEIYKENPFVDELTDKDPNENEIVLEATDLEYSIENYELMKYGEIRSHRARIFLDLAGFFDFDIKPRFFLSLAELDFGRIFWNGCEEKVKLAVVKNASNLLKTWEGFDSLVYELNKRENVKSYVVDRRVGNFWAHSFREAMSIVSGADYVIAPDTALSNGSASIGKPTITLFGYRNGNVFKQMFPSMIVFQKPCVLDSSRFGCEYNLRCVGEGMRDFRAKENISPAKCLSSISVKEILSFLEDLDERFA